MWRAKRKKNASRLLIKIFLLSVPIMLISLTFLVYKMGIFNVTDINIEAGQTNCIEIENLKNSSGLLGLNLLVIDSRKLAEELKRKIICIRDVRISKAFPNKLVIKLADRQPVARLTGLKEKIASVSALIENIATPSSQENLDSYLVDDEGVVFSKGIDNANLPKIFVHDLNISLGEKLRSDLISCLKILAKLKIFGVNVRDLWVIDKTLIVNSEAGWPKIVFRLDDEIDIQLASLQLILAEAKINRGIISTNVERNRRTVPTEVGINLKELEFIDLRFDKPIVKFAPKK